MIYCQECGTANSDGTLYCQACGAGLQNKQMQSQPYSEMVIPVYAQPAGMGQQPMEYKPRASKKCLVAGILCMVFSPIFLSVVFGPIAIIKGANVIKRFGKTGPAIAAIVLGVLGIFLSVMLLILYIGIL